MRNIKLIRVTRDYTQLKVQLDTGISQSMLSKYETGEALPTTENLMILAQYYKTSMDYLMDMTDDCRPYPPKRDSGTGSGAF
ncbi:MAG: helix-turn-helix transcriptional regulator [Oscillospiraceae bacterium]|nr:helix-turn-helix transcriptional regulator [Oscillospiraceae bacterium]